MNNNINYIFNLIEALMFIQGEDGLNVKSLQEILNFDKAKSRELLTTFMEKFNKLNRGLKVINNNDNFYLVTREEFFNDIGKLANKQKTTKLSNAALEVVAIIAFKGPITKSQINEIRAINSDLIVNTLLSKNLISEVGFTKKNGNPILYNVTDQFYNYFGIKSLKELPQIIEFEQLQIEDDNYDLFSSQQE